MFCRRRCWKKTLHWPGSRRCCLCLWHLASLAGVECVVGRGFRLGQRFFAFLFDRPNGAAADALRHVFRFVDAGGRRSDYLPILCMLPQNGFTRASLAFIFFQLTQMEDMIHRLQGIFSLSVRQYLLEFLPEPRVGPRHDCLTLGSASCDAGEKKHTAKVNDGRCTHSSDCNSPFERWVGECVDGKCNCASGSYVVFGTSDASTSSAAQKACVLPSGALSSRRPNVGAGHSGLRLARTPPGLRCLADVNCGPVQSGYCWIGSKEFKGTSMTGEVAWGRCVCEGGSLMRLTMW